MAKSQPNLRTPDQPSGPRNFDAPDITDAQSSYLEQIAEKIVTPDGKDIDLRKATGPEARTILSLMGLNFM